MEGRKEVWGVYAKKSRVPVRDRLRLDYYLSIGVHSSKARAESEFFITSPRIREGIASLMRSPGIAGMVKNLGGLRIGYIEVSKALGEKTFHVDAYYPTFSLERQFGEEFSGRLKGMGLASLAELHIVKGLERQFPGHKIILGKERDSEERLRQLGRRGEKIGAEKTLASARKRLRAYVVGKARRGSRAGRKMPGKPR